MIPEVSHEDEQIYFYLWEQHMNLMLKMERKLFPCVRKITLPYPLDLSCRRMILNYFWGDGKPALLEYYYASKKKIIMDYFKKTYPHIIFEIKMTGEYKGKQIRKEFS